MLGGQQRGWHSRRAWGGGERRQPIGLALEHVGRGSAIDLEDNSLGQHSHAGGNRASSSRLLERSIIWKASLKPSSPP